MKELIEKVSLTELLVIIICGIGLVLSILRTQTDLSMAIGGGLVGYLGGVTVGGK